METISHCTCISKHHIVYFKYIVLFVREITSLWEEEKLLPREHRLSEQCGRGNPLSRKAKEKGDKLLNSSINTPRCGELSHGQD